MASQQITCEVVYISKHVSFYLRIVYAHNTKEEMKELWSDLVKHHSIYSKPWLLVGDINSALKAENRKGGNTMAWA